MEVLVIDDGSSDERRGAWRIYERLARGPARIEEIESELPKGPW